MHIFVFVFARSPIQQPTFCFFVVFVFVYSSFRNVGLILFNEFKKFANNDQLVAAKKFERLMCEVEFWEVF